MIKRSHGHVRDVRSVTAVFRGRGGSREIPISILRTYGGESRPGLASLQGDPWTDGCQDGSREMLYPRTVLRRSLPILDPWRACP